MKKALYRCAAALLTAALLLSATACSSLSAAKDQLDSAFDSAAAQVGEKLFASEKSDSSSLEENNLPAEGSETQSSPAEEAGPEPESEAQPAQEEIGTTDGVTPEFKQSMDALEAFFDEYVAFMKDFENSDDTLGMLARYTSMMTQYQESMAALDEINEDELSAADLLYYTQTLARIYQKLDELG